LSPLGLFGDGSAEGSDESLPADPAEWLASLGAGSSDVDDEES
jgi:hypothetical protein